MIITCNYTKFYLKFLSKYKLYKFSIDKNKHRQSQLKVQTRSFKKNVINDFSKIAYQSQQPLSLVNNKYLIYQNHRSIFTKLIQASYYWVPFCGIGALIYTNPFADIFPAAIPILYFLDIVIFKLWLNKIKWNQNIVSQIYLLENGQVSQIWYDNRMKRKLFGEDEKKIYYNSVFVNPDYEKEEVILMNKDKRIFPINLNQAEKHKQGYAWVKHFSNGQNFLVIPKKGNLMNLKVMIQVFNGKIIKNKRIV